MTLGKRPIPDRTLAVLTSLKSVKLLNISLSISLTSRLRSIIILGTLAIKNFEPKLALTDGSDGLKFYYRFADVLKNILHENGQFYCEIGQLDTLETINNIFLNQGYNVSFIKDLNKDIRFLRINY